MCLLVKGTAGSAVSQPQLLELKLIRPFISFRRVIVPAILMCLSLCTSSFVGIVGVVILRVHVLHVVTSQRRPCIGGGEGDGGSLGDGASTARTAAAAAGEAGLA